jgi:putative tributyrin esterase
MALIRADFFSPTLLLNVSVDVALPQEAALAARRAGGRLPVLWLLHGEGEDQSAWQRYSRVEQRAEEAGLAVVMPAAETSFYADMEYGYRYFDFVSRELPEACREMFPLSSAREDNLVAGGGMGGYGALKIALSLPENYGAAACLSGGNFPAGPAPSAAFLGTLPAAVRKVPLLCFGIEGEGTIYDMPSLMGTSADLFELARRAAASGARLPSIYMACGESDPFLPNALKTKDRLASMPGHPFELEWREEEGGHDWDFLDGALAGFLRFARRGR